MVTKIFSNICRLSILIPVNVGTCQFLGQSYGPRRANASILMKFCTLNKSRMTNSMVTIAFCDLWRLSNLVLLNIRTCHLLGHIFKQELQEIQFGEFLYKAQINDAEFNGGNTFLWFLILVNFHLVSIGTCYVLGYKFGRRTVSLSILMKLSILYKSKALSSMVTIALCSFWRPPVKIDTCQFWHR